MNGIVLEKCDDKIIVMTDDGQFIEKKGVNNSVDIGEEIIIDNNYAYKRNHNSLRRLISIAAAIILMITGGFGVYGCYYPFGYVNVDINPSVEIAYNLYHKVISINGLNRDGEIIVSKVQNYKNKSVNEVIDRIIDNAVEDRYITDSKENTILVTVSEKGSKINDEEIYESVKEHIKEINIPTEVVMEESNKKIFNEAKEKGISPGKLKLLNKAIESNKNVDIEEIKDKPVKDIMNMIKENKKNNKEKEKGKEKGNNGAKKEKVEKVEKREEDNRKNEVPNEDSSKFKEIKDKNKDNKVKNENENNNKNGNDSNEIEKMKPINQPNGKANGVSNADRDKEEKRNVKPNNKNNGKGKNP